MRTSLPIESITPLNLQPPASANSVEEYTLPPPPVPFSDEIKYLGVYLDPTNITVKILPIESRRLSLPRSCLKPLISHSCLPPSWKLTVYRAIVLSILTYDMDSVLLTSPQIRKLDALHCKSLRRIFKIKSSFYHRVLEPSTAQCSNQSLASLSCQTRKVITPFQLYSQQRLQLCGHIHRHPESIENKCTYMSSHTYRHLSAPNRPGKPKIHWAESCMTQAASRIDHLFSNAALSRARIL